MTNQMAALESRIARLEASARRWRAASMFLTCAALAGAALGFRQPQVPQALETDRLILRAPDSIAMRRNARVELSIGVAGDLQVRFLGDDLRVRTLGDSVRVGPPPVPLMRLISADGREAARLGATAFHRLEK